MPRKPPREEPEGSPLPELDDATDAFDLDRSFDPGAQEPVDALPLDPETLGVDGEIELDSSEPEGTLFDDLPRLDVLIRPTDDLEDFSTQEEIPMLPWQIDAELLEIGQTLPAVLDPTRATTCWERPGGGEPQRLTVRLRMVVVPITLEVVDGPTERLRVGRDVLSGRVVILVE